MILLVLVMDNYGLKSDFDVYYKQLYFTLLQFYQYINVLLPWHRNVHLSDVLQKVVGTIAPGNDHDLSKTKIEDGVGGAVVEQAKHEDTCTLQAAIMLQF